MAKALQQLEFPIVGNQSKRVAVKFPVPVIEKLTTRMAEAMCAVVEGKARDDDAE